MWRAKRFSISNGVTERALQWIVVKTIVTRTGRREDKAYGPDHRLQIFGDELIAIKTAQQLNENDK